MRLIDADELKKAIIEIRYDYVEDNFFWTKLFDIIDNASTVEQKYYERVIAQINPVIEERPQGKWIRKGNETNFWYECDKCGCEPYYSHSIRTIKFCPNCGADMRGEEE